MPFEVLKKEQDQETEDKFEENKYSEKKEKGWEEAISEGRSKGV
jgi:hypothetical protein